MIKKYTYEGLTWIDLESPSLEEVGEIMGEYKIDPLVAEELVTPTLRPKVDLYNDFIYLILHFPAFKHDSAQKRSYEIDFVIGKNVLITTHYDDIDPLHMFSKTFEEDKTLSKEKFGTHAGFIFFHMMRNLYHSLLDELAFIKSDLDRIEDGVFDGKEQAMVMELSKINRELLDFKEAISVHKEVLESFEAASKNFFGQGFDYHSRSIIGEYYKVKSAVDSSREYLSELRNTNDSLLTTKQTAIMTRFTVIAFIFLPLSFMAALFGMSMDTPLIHSNTDLVVIFVLMLILGSSTFAIFKYKKML